MEWNNWRAKGSFKRDWGKRKSLGRIFFVGRNSVDFKIIIKRILMIGIMKNIGLKINNGNIFNWKRWNGIIEGLSEIEEKDEEFWCRF